MDKLQFVKDFNENDPLPDLFNRWLVGAVVKTSDGRRFRKRENGEWELLGKWVEAGDDE